MSDAREELNRSVRELSIQSRYSIMSLKGMGSSSHDIGAEIRMHSVTVNCDTIDDLGVHKLLDTVFYWKMPELFVQCKIYTWLCEHVLKQCALHVCTSPRYS